MPREPTPTKNTGLGCQCGWEFAQDIQVAGVPPMPDIRVYFSCPRCKRRFVQKFHP